MKIKQLHILSLLLLISLSFQMNAQDFSKHKWKNRVLLVLTDNINSQKFQNQIKAVQNQDKEHEERKLIIYQITENEYKLGFSEENQWIKNFKLYHKIKTKGRTFEVILIGLDGGEKLRQDELLTSDKLFALIDGMPMRRAEIKKKN